MTSYIRFVNDVCSASQQKAPNLSVLEEVLTPLGLSFFFSVLPTDSLQGLEALALLYSITSPVKSDNPNVTKNVTVAPVGSAIQAARQLAPASTVQPPIDPWIVVAAMCNPRERFPLLRTCLDLSRGQTATAKAPAKTPQKPTGPRPTGPYIPTPPKSNKVVVRSKTVQPAATVLPQTLYDLQTINPDGTLSPRPPSRKVGCGLEVSGVAVDDESLRLLFQQYDTNGSGTIDREEFKLKYKTFESYGVFPTDKEVERLFAKYDQNKDGTLGFEEFAMLMLHRFKM
eukprot:PhF_6_TR35175/c0_g1_i1/m.51242